MACTANGSYVCTPLGERDNKEKTHLQVEQCLQHLVVSKRDPRALVKADDASRDLTPLFVHLCIQRKFLSTFNNLDMTVSIA